MHMQPGEARVTLFSNSDLSPDRDRSAMLIELLVIQSQGEKAAIAGGRIEARRK